MGTLDPLTTEAMRVLSDIKDPLSNGDALDGFVDALIDEGADLKGIIRVLLSDAIEAQRLASIKALHYAFGEARDYLAGQETKREDEHSYHGVNRGDFA